MGFADFSIDVKDVARLVAYRLKLASAMTAVALLAIACSTSADPLRPESPAAKPKAVGELKVVITNHGGNMEGHTPRGFQGMGTGLFAGDNLNSRFPNGDGVQIFLTFDLENLPVRQLKSAILRTTNIHLRGSPFRDLGPLRAQEVRYDRFSSALWNLDPLAEGHTCIFATEDSDAFECDVTEVVKRSIQDNYKYAQFRLRMEKAGDEDGNADLVSFFKIDSNTNERGIFEVEIALTQ